MKRRKVIQSLGLLSSHVLFPSIVVGFVSSCKNTHLETYLPQFFTQEEFDILVEVIDIIIPATSTLSASQVNTHHFIDEVFYRCMNPEQKSLIRKGVSDMISAFKSADNKLKYLEDLDNKSYNGDEDAAYFRSIKQYTMVGFFTSQEGTTNASNYVKFPGDYIGEIKMETGTLNYGKTNLRYYL